jgi:hypothetical protein
MLSSSAARASSYRPSVKIVLLPSAYGVAQVYAYAAYNSDYLTGRRIYPRVTAMRLDQATKKAYVSLRADASSPFPSVLRGVVVNGEGEAEARLGSR